MCQLQPRALVICRERRKQSRRSTVTIKEIVEDRRKRRAEAARAEAQNTAAAEAVAPAAEAEAETAERSGSARASKGTTAASLLPDDFLRMAHATPALGPAAAQEPATMQQCLFPAEVPPVTHAKSSKEVRVLRQRGLTHVLHHCSCYMLPVHKVLLVSQHMCAVAFTVLVSGDEEGHCTLLEQDICCAAGIRLLRPCWHAGAHAGGARVQPSGLPRLRALRSERDRRCR